MAILSSEQYGNGSVDIIISSIDYKTIVHRKIVSFFLSFTIINGGAETILGFCLIVTFHLSLFVKS